MPAPERGYRGWDAGRAAAPRRDGRGRGASFAPAVPKCSGPPRGRSDTTRSRATDAGLTDVDTLAELVGRSRPSIISVCPPHAALDQARGPVAACGFERDVRRCQRGCARERSEIAATAGRVTDGGLAASSAARPVKGTRCLYVSGPGADDVAKLRGLAARRDRDRRRRRRRLRARCALRRGPRARAPCSSPIRSGGRGRARRPRPPRELGDLVARSPRAVLRGAPRADARPRPSAAWARCTRSREAFPAAGLPEGFHRTCRRGLRAHGLLPGCRDAPTLEEVVAAVTQSPPSLEHVNSRARGSASRLTSSSPIGTRIPTSPRSSGTSTTRTPAWRRCAARTARTLAVGETAARVEQTPDAMIVQWHLERRLATLADTPAALCFGRLDEEVGEHFYIGRRHVEDADGDPVVVDWRAPRLEPLLPRHLADAMGLARATTLQRRRTGARRHLRRALRRSRREPAAADCPTPSSPSSSGRAPGRCATSWPPSRPSRTWSSAPPLEELVIVQGGPGTGQDGGGPAPRRLPALRAPRAARTAAAARDRSQPHLPPLHRAGAPVARRDRGRPGHHREPDGRPLSRARRRQTAVAELKGDARHGRGAAPTRCTTASTCPPTT